MQQSALLKNRAQLARRLLEDLILAARKGRKSYTIQFSDQLAPRRWRKHQLRIEASLSHIGDWLNSICSICPPATDGGPSGWWMSPDEADHNEHPPERIRTQWVPALNAHPEWMNAVFEALDRWANYGKFGEADAHVCTGSTEPYGNILVRVNPSASAVLTGLYAGFEPKVFGVLSESGHTDRVVVIPAGSPNQSDIRTWFEQAGLDVVRVPVPASTVIQELSKLWIPDRHVPKPQDFVKRPFIHCEGCAPFGILDGDWKDEMRWQQATLKEFARATTHEAVVLLIIAQGGANDPHAILVNGVSGANGGF